VAAAEKLEQAEQQRLVLQVLAVQVLSFQLAQEFITLAAVVVVLMHQAAAQQQELVAQVAAEQVALLTLLFRQMELLELQTKVAVAVVQIRLAQQAQAVLVWSCLNIHKLKL
jgi:hypothetical protein